MITEDRLCLTRIRARFGDTINQVSKNYGLRPEVLAGIMFRETRGGESKYLIDEYHTPENKADDTGDAGHGHGLMQIDDRSFPDFCNSPDWKVPYSNVRFAAIVLTGKRSYLAAHQVPAEILERAAIAAYNCGEGNVLRSFQTGESLDTHTAEHNYSAYVLAAAEEYAKICAAAEQPAEVPTAAAPPAVPDEFEEKKTSIGFIASLWQLILKIFVGKKAVQNETKAS